MILMIDNYDSFVYNLYQYIGIFDSDIRVIRNDKLTLEDIHRMAPERIVLSPGPKAPKDAGICLDVVKEFQDKIPILGHLPGTSDDRPGAGRHRQLREGAVSWQAVADLPQGQQHLHRY